MRDEHFEVISNNNGRGFTGSYKNDFIINLIWGTMNWSEEV